MNCPYCDKIMDFPYTKSIGYCRNHNIKVAFYTTFNLIELSEFPYSIYLNDDSITLYYNFVIVFASKDYTIKISPDNFYQIIPKLIKLNCLA